jgi:hypothetical protein
MMRMDKSTQKLMRFGVTLLALLITLCLAITEEVLAEKPEWQITAEAVPLLGLRDKWGASGSFTADFVVTAADGKIARVRKTGRRNDWCQVRFPYDFKGPAAGANGNFSYKIIGNGKVIAIGTFEYRPFEVKVGIPRFP